MFESNGGHLTTDATPEQVAEFEAKAESVAQKAAQQDSAVGKGKAKKKEDDWDKPHNGHENKHSYLVSAEALDNDEPTYKESVVIASNPNATGEDLKTLVRDRQYQDSSLEERLKGVDLNKVDWDTKLSDIREAHDIDASGGSSEVKVSQSVRVPGGFGENSYTDLTSGELNSVNSYRQDKVDYHGQQERENWETLEADYIDEDTGEMREDADPYDYYELATAQNHHIAAGIAYDAPPNATIAEVEGGSVYAYYDADGNKLDSNDAFTRDVYSHGHADFVHDPDQDIWGVPDNLRADSDSVVSAENGDFIDLKKAREWSHEQDPNSDSRTIKNNEKLMDIMTAREVSDDESVNDKNTFVDEKKGGQGEFVAYSSKQKRLNIFD